MSPQLKEQVTKINQQLSSVGPLNSLASAVGTSPLGAAALGAAVTLGSMMLMFDLGAGLIMCLCGLVYPLQQSFRSVEGSSNEDRKFWLQYWVIYSLFSLSEGVLDTVLFWVPLLSVFKAAFLVYLFFPKYRGAAVVFAHLSAPLSQCDSMIVEVLQSSGVAHKLPAEKAD